MCQDKSSVVLSVVLPLLRLLRAWSMKTTVGSFTVNMLLLGFILGVSSALVTETTAILAMTCACCLHLRRARNPVRLGAPEGERIE